MLHGQCHMHGCNASTPSMLSTTRFSSISASCTQRRGWLGSRVVSVLDSDAEGPGFKSQPRRCKVTVLGKLLTPMPLITKQRLVAALLRVASVTAGMAESNGSLLSGL